MDIQITFINESYDQNNSNVVIFQKNVADPSAPTVAWHVIELSGRQRTHQFGIPKNFYVTTQDSWGNFSPLQVAENGQTWNLVGSASGDVLTLDPYSAGGSQVEIKNCLATGTINAQIYLGGHLLATKNGLSPQQKAVFGFKPTVWVGVVSQIAEGDIMDSAILDDVNTEISLSGITKANLIMTGGGGSTAQPFKFTLVPTA